MLSHLHDEDESDDDDVVLIGRPLTEFKEGELTDRKRGLRDDETVRDAQGRKRFHGAFTGGFSAGYYNTVGTEAGWQPSTFRSTVNKDKEGNFSRIQTAKDFMDEEDLAEFGFAETKVQTRDGYGGPSKPYDRKENDDVFGSMIPKFGVVKDLIAIEDLTVGMQLLSRMGWRPGSNRLHSIKPKKVFGCAPPPGNDKTDLPPGDEIQITEVLDETTPMLKKLDTHGLGYSGIKGSLSNPNALSQSKELFGGLRKKGIKGQGFGIGALEDTGYEDEDIYGEENMVNYNYELSKEDDENDEQTFGWTKSKSVKTIVGSGSSLPGFALEDVMRPFDKEENVDSIEADIPEDFTVIPVNDNQKTVIATQPIKPMPTPETRGKMLSKEEPQLAPMPQEPPRESLVVQLKEGKKIKPYISDSAKQSRFERYTSVMDSLDELSDWQRRATGKSKFALKKRQDGVRRQLAKEFTDSTGCTEWEVQREIEEFAQTSRATQSFNPGRDLQSRFSGGTFLDKPNDVDADNASESGLKPSTRITRAKRTSVKWIPEDLLCKRFNVPQPYPDEATTSFGGQRGEKSGPGGSRWDTPTSDSATASAKSTDGFCVFAHVNTSGTPLDFSHTVSSLKGGESTTKDDDDASNATKPSGSGLAPAADPDALDIPRASDDLFRSIFGDDLSELAPPQNAPTTAAPPPKILHDLTSNSRHDDNNFNEEEQSRIESGVSAFLADIFGGPQQVENKPTPKVEMPKEESMNFGPTLPPGYYQPDDDNSSSDNSQILRPPSMADSKSRHPKKTKKKKKHKKDKKTHKKHKKSHHK